MSLAETPKAKKSDSVQQRGNADHTNSKDYLGESIYKSEMTELAEVKDSPFTVVREGKNWYGMLGKYRLTRANSDRKAVEKEISRISWDNIMKVISVMLEEYKAGKEVKNE